MAQELETKVLNVNKESMASKLEGLGAKQILNTKLTVDWFRLKGIQEGQDPWYLRIRNTSDGKTEVTWKGQSTVHGASRSHKEINFPVADSEKMADLFCEIGLESYAHQEKYRTSWVLNEWRFDLDQYPGMPAYLEIEGKSEEHIQEALTLLGLTNHKTSSEGERVLIQKEFGLNWYDMRFEPIPAVVS